MVREMNKPSPTPFQAVMTAELKEYETEYALQSAARAAAIEAYHKANAVMHSLRNKVRACRQLLDLSVPEAQWRGEDEKDVNLGLPMPGDDPDSGVRLSDVK